MQAERHLKRSIPLYVYTGEKLFHQPFDRTREFLGLFDELNEPDRELPSDEWGSNSSSGLRKTKPVGPQSTHGERRRSPWEKKTNGENQLTSFHETIRNNSWMKIFQDQWCFWKKTRTINGNDFSYLFVIIKNSNVIYHLFDFTFDFNFVFFRFWF